MTFKRFPIALALLAGALSGATTAQDPGTAYPPAKPESPAATEPKAVVTIVSTPARASDIIGTEIVDASDKRVGEVDDLLVAKDGQVCALVDRKDAGLAAIPLDKLTAKMDSKAEPAATPDVDKFAVADVARLQSAPTIKDKDKIDVAWVKSSCDHYKGNTPAAGDKPEGAEKTASAAEHPVCAKKLIGTEIETTSGDDVGEIQDLAIDLSKGKVAYAVLSVGGVLGVGEKHHGMALDRLTPHGDKYQVPATKDELKDKPGIDIKRLPSGPNLSLGTGTTPASKGAGAGT